MLNYEQMAKKVNLDQGFNLIYPVQYLKEFKLKILENLAIVQRIMHSVAKVSCHHSSC